MSHTHTGDETDWNVLIKTDVIEGEKAYAVSVEVGPESVTLTPDRALRYAQGVMRAAQRAAYDAAVFRQLTKTGAGATMQEVAQLVASMREDRVPLDPEATHPIGLEPGVNQAMEPFLVVSVGGRAVGQWSYHAAKDHALIALAAVEAAELDTGYYRALTGIVGLEEGSARGAIAALEGFWPDWGQPA